MTRGTAVVLLLCLSLTAALGGCAITPAPAGCPLADQKPMTLIRLYFGRDIAGRGPVSDSEWSSFAHDVLTPHFPDGFTVFRGNGQWQDPGSHQVVREDSVIVEVAVDAGKDASPHVNAVTQAYKQQFHQEAVGVIAQPVCAHF